LTATCYGKILKPIRRIKKKIERKKETSPSQQAENCCIDSGTRLISKNIKITGEAASADEETGATFLCELKQNYQGGNLCQDLKHGRID
jgi:hypothetical protein